MIILFLYIIFISIIPFYPLKLLQGFNNLRYLVVIHRSNLKFERSYMHICELQSLY
jgi:hypothetical protein